MSTFFKTKLGVRNEVLFNGEYVQLDIEEFGAGNVVSFMTSSEARRMAALLLVYAEEADKGDSYGDV